MESLAAWLARRASLLRSLRIDWIAEHVDAAMPVSSVLQQSMPGLTSLSVQWGDGRGSFKLLACLARHHPQLTALAVGIGGQRPFEEEILIDGREDQPPMTWLTGLQRLRQLHLSGFNLHPSTAVALGQLTGLASLAVNVMGGDVRQALQASLQQLRSLTSLSAAFPWQHPEQEEEEDEQEEGPPLDVGGLPSLAVLQLAGGEVCSLGASGSPLTWLQLHDTKFGMEELCQCSRLVGLKASLYSFNNSLFTFCFGEAGDQPERDLPDGSLPALRTLTLCVSESDPEFAGREPMVLPDELCTFTALTQLVVQASPVRIQTAQDWRRSMAESSLWGLSLEVPDSKTLERESFAEDKESAPSLEVGPDFYLPHLQELSLLNCRLLKVPEFIADLPELHTLRLSGNPFGIAWGPTDFPGLPGTVCKTLQRLELRGCFLQAVPPYLSHLTALTALDLSGNRTLEIAPSDVHIFSCLTGLRKLRLAKPPGLVHEAAEWRQGSVEALLDLQRTCSWLDLRHALQREGSGMP
ncbi:hypothetical protein COHA_005024 [Chlorella ohadii]|uniref:Uncharacterized protein n=1 Tax=Chlorella ohadii TaxID=2649997 RepID=A0AAD5H2B4_9CHLO|nr:hypothetical protein COHA_005024 [Chlorella ohadii]